MDNDITIEQVKNYLDKNFKRGNLALNALNKTIDGINAIFSTRVGRDILVDDINRFETLLVKLAAQEVSDEEKAEFRYLKERLSKLSHRIEIYLKTMQDIKK